MTEVRIRHELHAASQHLAEVPFDRLDRVIPTIQAWGLGDGGEQSLFGQFVYDGDQGRSYFEIVISDDGSDS